AAIAHELKHDLLNLAEQVNRFLASIQLERRDLQREHDRNTVMGVNPADYDEDNPEDPHIFDGVFPLWHKLLGEIVAHVGVADGAPTLRALGARVITDHQRFEQIAGWTSTVWTALSDVAGAQEARGGGALAITNVIKDVGLASGVLAAVII